MRAGCNAVWLRGRMIAAIILFAGIGAGCHKAPAPVITLSVAASLQDAIAEVEAAYQKDHSGLQFRNNFGSSGTLAREIEQGAPVDAILSAGAKQVDALDHEGLLVQGTRIDLLRNALVLVVPANSKLDSFAGLSAKDTRLIALGDPASVPAGQYGQQTLKSLNLYNSISNKIVLCKDVRQVLTYVETGEADAGLVYLTDAQKSNRVRMVATAPESSHDPIVYPVAAVKGSHEEQATRDFLAFLSSSTAQAIFKRYGFAMA